LLAPYVEAWPPDYVEVFEWRQKQVVRFRKNPQTVVMAREYYKTKGPAEFCQHWCDTYDPRNAGTDRLTRFPFLLFKRQRELFDFLLLCLRDEQSGLIEKCRDMGATWACVVFSVWLWLFHEGASVGWGSRKELLVDRIGDADSIFEKIRILIQGLPPELLPAGFVPSVHMAYMRIVNPENGATITGESGDNIGRGGRKLIYFKDESAHYEHPEKIEAALTDNTRCAIDISSVNGLSNVFHRKREAGIDWDAGQGITKGRTNVFVMDWRDHPAKTQEWYDARKKKATDDGLLHIFAQEVDRNYSSSVVGVIIPQEWVEAAVDAHKKLELGEIGRWGAALDVADGGLDTNALVKRKGIVLKSIEEWGERDTGVTTRRAVQSCKGIGRIELQYDSVGVGSGVKAEANRLIDDKLMPDNIVLVAWSAGAGVQDPLLRVVPGDKDSPLNEDFYKNFKAQGWWALRRRFELTYRAINEPGFTNWDADDLISLPSELPLLRKLMKELSQATASDTGPQLKLIVNKSPDGTKSPNLADAVMMCYFPVKKFTPAKPVFSNYGQ
jgi:phage terminase large subunit